MSPTGAPDRGQLPKPVALEAASESVNHTSNVPMGRIECGECRNLKKPDEWDAAHE